MRILLFVLSSALGAGCVATRRLPVHRASPETVAAIRTIAAEMDQAAHGIIFYPRAQPAASP